MYCKKYGIFHFIISSSSLFSKFKALPVHHNTVDVHYTLEFLRAEYILQFGVAFGHSDNDISDCPNKIGNCVLLLKIEFFGVAMTFHFSLKSFQSAERKSTRIPPHKHFFFKLRTIASTKLTIQS